MAHRVCRNLLRRGWLEVQGEAAFLSDCTGVRDAMDALRMRSIDCRIASGAHARQARRQARIPTLPRLAAPQRRAGMRGESTAASVYGARAFKCANQHQLENPPAKRILAGEFKSSDTNMVGTGAGRLAFDGVKAQAAWAAPRRGGSRGGGYDSQHGTAVPAAPRGRTPPRRGGGTRAALPGGGHAGAAAGHGLAPHGEYIGQLQQPVLDPLLAVLEAATGQLVLPAEECATHAARDAVVETRRFGVDQVAAGEVMAGVSPGRSAWAVSRAPPDV